ncbi:MAG: short-chain dehydrogenase [Calditrichaeota bacterium]|nr:short-chain dehydrogenase [Calditrichota bacterium]
MEITGRNVLVLGGWGLVGTAVCRQLLPKRPRRIVVGSLTRAQAEEVCAELQPHAGNIEIAPAWGNIFVRSEYKDLTRNEILGDTERRLTMASDVLERTTATSFKHFYLYDLITKEKPDIIIDCVNTATGVAYQDIYSAGLRVLEGVKQARVQGAGPEFLSEVEKLLGTLYIPQVVRHVQVIYAAMKTAGTKTYIKVGTSGTGGMGLNIPYTHSEDRPSRVLLSKTSIAGSHSLLLFLMGRTPDGPYVKEVKPSTAIAWKRIERGEILKAGKPIPLFDCSPDAAVELKSEFDAAGHPACQPLNRNLEGVFIDTGENGTFSVGEFSAITTYGQMEYITPEEIAQTIIWEIEGGNSGHDVVGALDAAILGPTYRAGLMRSLALQKIHELARNFTDNPVAFELLGPPRLSKLLYEAHILNRIAGSIDGVMSASAADLSQRAADLIARDISLRSRIISIAIPILMPDGKRLLRGPEVKVPADPRRSRFSITAENIDNWCHNGWVDLRIANMERWQCRFKRLLEQVAAVDISDTSSQILRDKTFWHPDKPLDEGEIVGWIFIDEDDGNRMK